MCEAHTHACIPYVTPHQAGKNWWNLFIYTQYIYNPGNQRRLAHGFQLYGINGFQIFLKFNVVALPVSPVIEPIPAWPSGAFMTSEPSIPSSHAGYHFI